jgi:hypothetical protein
VGDDVQRGLEILTRVLQHRRLARAQQPFQARRGVHAALAAADDQDSRPYGPLFAPIITS